ISPTRRAGRTCCWAGLRGSETRPERARNPTGAIGRFNQVVKELGKARTSALTWDGLPFFDFLWRPNLGAFCARDCRTWFCDHFRRFRCASLWEAREVMEVGGNSLRRIARLDRTILNTCIYEMFRYFFRIWRICGRPQDDVLGHRTNPPLQGFGVLGIPTPGLCSLALASTWADGLRPVGPQAMRRFGGPMVFCEVGAAHPTRTGWQMLNVAGDAAGLCVAKPRHPTRELKWRTFFPRLRFRLVCGDESQ